MSNASPSKIAKDRPVSAPKRIAKTASASSLRLKGERRYAFVVIAAMAGVLSLAVWLAISIASPMISPGSTQHAATSSSPAEHRTGNIVFEPAANRCRQIVFDNDTGRRVETNEPCGEVAGNDKGKPMGTVRRLDAISKSFFKTTDR